MLPQTKDHVVAIYRAPFSLGTPEVLKWREGWSVLDMAAEMDFLPNDFLENGIVLANGKQIPNEDWDKFVPAMQDVVTHVTFHAPIQGGGGDGGKNVIGIIAAIGLTIATSGIASGALLPNLSGSIASSLSISATAGAAILAGGVSIIGGLAISALTAPPVNRNVPANTDDGSGSTSLAKASLSGNTLQPNAAIPRVIGTRRVFPPFAYEPIPEIIGQDEYISASYVLAGAHEMTDFQIGESALDINNIDSDLEVYVFDGRPSSTPAPIPNLQGRTSTFNIEMSKHQVDPENGSLSANNGALPVFHGMMTADSPDEAWIHFMLQGLILQNSPSSVLRIPFRIRMRRIGDTVWRNLPELHLAENTQSQRRYQIKFKFAPLSGGRTQPRADKGWIEARKVVPAQNVPPLGTTFTSDSYFSSASGNDVYRNDTVNTTNVINVNLEPETATFFLDPASWPAGVYQIEIKRGAAFDNVSFTSSTYSYGGSIRDFFGILTSRAMPLNTENLLDSLVLTRCVSVRFQKPIRQENLATVYIRARNRAVDKLSVKASAYVRNFNGTNWNTIEKTSNPAAHFLDLMTGEMNSDPIPEELIDFDSLQDWWTRCNSEGLKCDMVVDSGTVADTMSLVASCGYAQPFHSELWGVVQDYDRSAETPVQIFTSRNSAGLNWKKALPKLPTGLRVNYSDILYDYDQRQINVYREGAEDNDAQIEQTTYEGIVEADKIVRRARFDLRQGAYRSAVYSLSTSAEALKCRKGSLVGINHDLVTRMRGAARVSEVILNDSGLISGLVLDQTVNVLKEEEFLTVANFNAVINVNDLGLRTGCTIRRSNGLFTTHEVSNVSEETDTIYFTTPFADDVTDGSFFDKGKIPQVKEGCLVAVGELNNVQKRYIVTEISNGAGLSANLTLVDEAPQLWE